MDCDVLYHKEPVGSKPLSRVPSDTVEEYKALKPKTPTMDYQNQILRNGKGSRIELQMSRGPPVRGTLVDYDPEFQKLAVMEDVGNNQRKLTFVKLNYVSAFSVYGVTLKDEA